MSLCLTCGRSYPGNVGVNAEAPVATTECAGEAPGALARSLVVLTSPHTTICGTSISGINVQVTFKVTSADE